MHAIQQWILRLIKVREEGGTHTTMGDILGADYDISVNDVRELSANGFVEIHWTHPSDQALVYIPLQTEITLSDRGRRTMEVWVERFPGPHQQRS